MVAAVRDISLRKAKRLRPALVALGQTAASGGVELRLVTEVGAALELLHSYLLIHDDWMDDDAVRRGGPTAHVMLSRKLGSVRLGNASAILAGDYALALAAELLAEVPVPERIVRPLLAAFAEMQEHAVLGQELDITATSPGPEAAYVLKTASYSVRGPLRLGAILGGGSRATLRALDSFATPIGVAFQLRDDLLGAFGDPRDTGKPLGSDLRSGKRTPLVLHALARARGRDRRAVLKALGNQSGSSKTIRSALEVLERSGARASVETRIDGLVRKGLAALRPPLSREGRDLLTGAALALTSRVR
jgi:geranylgeranyl diphosphate synthase type I